MPANRRSLAVTERYRSGMLGLRRRGQTEARRVWQSVDPDDLDGSFPLGRLELSVSTLQREAARLSSGYLSAFISSELGEPATPPPVTVWNRAWGGGDLRTGLRSAIVRTKMAIADGTEPREAVRVNRATLVNDVGLFIDTAARESLRAGMEADERVVGYQRALKGTCGACAGNVAVETSVQLPSIPLMVHPNCQCVTEPVVNAHQNRLDAKRSEQYLATRRYSVTSAERDLAQRYEGLDSLIPNRMLRSLTRALAEHEQRFVDGWDQLLRKFGALGQNMQVFRGIPADALEKATGRAIRELEGLTFTDRGFGSTTLLREEAAKWGAPKVFAENRAKTLWDITVSKDVKGVWMETATGRKWGLKELVVERNCRYVIEKVEMRDGIWHIKATLLPPK